MIFGVSPTQDAVVVARTMSSGETFAITSITSIQFQARSGDDLTALRHRLISIFDRVGKSPTLEGCTPRIVVGPV